MYGIIPPLLHTHTHRHVLNLMLCWSGEDKQGYEVALDRCLYFETEPKADCKFTYVHVYVCLHMYISVCICMCV
jgi:hypothetical protein